MKKLTRNAARCLKCGTVVESKHCHDFVNCKCGRVFVDGGLDYQRAGYSNHVYYEDLCEFEEDKPEDFTTYTILSVDGTRRDVNVRN